MNQLQAAREQAAREAWAKKGGPAFVQVDDDTYVAAEVGPEYIIVRTRKIIQHTDPIARAIHGPVTHRVVSIDTFPRPEPVREYVVHSHRSELGT